VNQRRLRDGWTPLFLASVFGNSSMVRSDFWTLYVMQLLHGQVRILASVCYATPPWSGQISSLCVFGNSSMVRSDLYIWQLLYCQVRFLASVCLATSLWPGQIALSTCTQHQGIIQPVRCNSHIKPCYMVFLYLYGYLDYVLLKLQVTIP